MKKVDDGAGGLVEQNVKFPVWFEPVANGGTPMSQALQEAKTVIESWLCQHTNSYPPIVINISDGAATDGDPAPHAEALRNLATSDGNVLMFNCHISSQTASPILFASSNEGLPDAEACLLFSMSSVLPHSIQQAACAEGFSVGEGVRGFAFNADLLELIRFLEFGTRPSNLR